MSTTLLQMICFLVYSLLFLLMGRQSFSESNSVAKFFIGERKNDVGRLFFTFVGTWVSAATILGFTGTVYMNGMTTLIQSVIPWFIGAVMLYLISGKLWENDVVSIPELIRKRYDSRGLQILSALLMAGCYVSYLVIQIKGFGIAASGLLHIDYRVAIFLVYLFILYSSFGGFNSVTRSDIMNLGMLAISIAALYAVVMSRTDGYIFLSDGILVREIGSKAEFPQNGGMKEQTFLYLTNFFGWGLGLAANPQYMIRILAAKDKRTAKKMIRCSLIFLAFLYFALTEIGLGLRLLFPQLRNYCTSDDVVVYALLHMIRSPLNGLFLLSIIGACVSTANSQLLLIGSVLSYDVLAQLSKKKLPEMKILFWSRIFIFIGGTAALFLSVYPPADTFSYGADIWGVFAVVLTPLIFGGLCTGIGTRNGAYAAFFGGLAAAALLQVLPVPVYWAFPATVCSCLAYLLVSLAERRKNGRSLKAPGSREETR